MEAADRRGPGTAGGGRRCRESGRTAFGAAAAAFSGRWGKSKD